MLAAWKDFISFHPFQGRPLFGLARNGKTVVQVAKEFPSLSGKTSIRTSVPERRNKFHSESVSIPFREDLYSDRSEGSHKTTQFSDLFPSLSGKTSIRTKLECPVSVIRRCIVSIPFREDLYSDIVVLRVRDRVIS